MLRKPSSITNPYYSGIAVAILAANLAWSVAVAVEPASPRGEDQPNQAIDPLSDRFADSEGEEVPNFQKHIVPLLGRLGCNGRACHGSFQGRGGFQLSLFGYDFKADHEAMLDEDTGRVDLEDVDESMILAKPTDADLHEGGKRYDKDSWQHHVLKRWVEAGAPFDQKEVQSLTKLEIQPAEIQFTNQSDHVKLRAIAHWQDGSAEDVTELCRFSSNDDSIADIDQNGRVQSGTSGDTHVVVYYDNAVVAVPIIRPVGPPAEHQPEYTHPVDRLVQTKLNKLGIVSAGRCTDAEFIRRASLDITGILPAADTVRTFLADKSSDKREKLLQKLLNSPGYAAWWATRFSDWTGNSEEQLNNVLPVRNAASRLWYEWLRVRLAANVPYDKIVEGIVTAKSREQGESYADYCKSMTEACKPGNENKFAERDGMPLYWTRVNFRQPEDRAIGFAYTFLGIRVECAQCHKHPFDQWSKNDFEEFAKLFSPVRFNQNQVTPDAKAERKEILAQITEGKDLKSNGDIRRAIQQAARSGEVVPFGELLIAARGMTSAERRKLIARAKKAGRKQPAPRIPTGKILGEPDLVELDKDPRPALMQWLRSPENPYFAKAVVNRVWSNYFGAGLVDPTDDMNLANPPANAALLDHLASELIQHEFDLKWLHHTIVTSETYQRSTDTNETNINDRTNLSRHLPRRLPAEVVHDAVLLATGSDTRAKELRGELEEMAIAEGQPRLRNQQNFVLEVFGQSIRETNCDCDRSDSPSLLQSIYLRNDSEMHKRLSDKNSWVMQACEALGVPGPVGAQDPRQLAAIRKTDAMRKQMIKRAQQFRRLPEARQENLRKQLEREFASAAKRVTRAGFAVPKFEELIADPEVWASLEPAEMAGNAEAVATVSDLIEEAYLRTLSRYPDENESKIALQFIEESEATAAGVQSLLWALVNTKEFIITH
ncbi:MAG: DUF1549 and DUF1553 domain-containing protein [Rubripirellula sp.]|nr:DUF1549 and DUF1553 domain-containing protein [Rubripirellula sp.]